MSFGSVSVSESEKTGRLLLVYNPTAGRGRHGLLRAVVEGLTAQGAGVDVRPTTGPDDAEAFGRAASRFTHDAVIVAGGDGTINGMVNGLMQAEAPPPLAIIPLGTANVLAAEIGLKPRAPQVIATILHGRPLPVYPAQANSRYFLLMAGVGFDSWVVHTLRPWLKRRFGKGGYVLEGLIQTGRYGFPQFDVVIDGQSHRARTVVACKGKRYGGTHILAPKADLGTPSLEVCLLPGGGMIHQMRYGLALAFGRLSTLPDVTVLSAKSLMVTGGEGILPVQCDGDDSTTLPLTITLPEQPLVLLHPPL